MKRNSGMSLIEAIMVMGLIMIVSSVALIQMRTSLTVLDADRASNLVMSQLRYARQVAVDQRRDVRITFSGSNRVQVIRYDTISTTTELVDVTLPAGYTYGLPNGPGDTPEGYGNGAGVYFNNEVTGRFLGDGTFVDDAGVLVSGSVFTIGGGNGSARAVTLSGATGRLKQYYLKGNTWVIRG